MQRKERCEYLLTKKDLLTAEHIDLAVIFLYNLVVRMELEKWVVSQKAKGTTY